MTRINETFFDIIDSEEKAYLLGFWFADGYNLQNQSVGIDLHEQDIDILRVIQTALAPDKKLQRLPFKNQYRFILNQNAHLSNSLIKHGCVPRKSRTLSFPTHLPHGLIRHFIRGYFDGDGSISIKRARNEFVFNICSTRSFCESVGQIFTSTLGIHHKIRPCTNSVSAHFLEVYGNVQVLKALAYLYVDSSISLRRKREKWEFCKHYYSTVITHNKHSKLGPPKTPIEWPSNNFVISDIMKTCKLTRESLQLRVKQAINEGILEIVGFSKGLVGGPKRVFRKVKG